jgi:hypothetical protein
MSKSTSDDDFNHYFSTPLDQLLAENLALDPQQKLLALFKRCAEQVPAYQHFL